MTERHIFIAAVVNEDPSQRMIRELREEVEQLRKSLGPGSGGVKDAAELQVCDVAFLRWASSATQACAQTRTR